MITVEDGPAVCEKRWRQTAMCDPDNTRQTSNGSPPRTVKTPHASQAQNIF